MSSQLDFKTDPKRDATASIRGYVYQMHQSVLAWIQLKEGEILILEGAEDFNIHTGSSVIATQVKDVSSNITLRTSDVIDAINNYWIHRERNPDYDIVLRFLTTAEAGQEQGSPLGSGQKGLEYWNSAEADHIDVEPLRTFLIKLELEAGLASFIKRATANELREKLISRVKWDMGNRPSEAIQYAIEDQLKIHGSKYRINTHYSCQVFPYLLTRVAGLLSTKGLKELRFSDFLTCFDDATTVCIPRGEMEAITSRSGLQQPAGIFDMAGIVQLANSAPTIGKPLPNVDGGIARTKVVSSLSRLLNDQRVIFLCGSSGLGKTNLASLISHEVGGSWGWAGFRSMQPEQIKDVLTRAAYEMNANSLPPFLVLDDVDLSRVTFFEREFISLVFSVINANGMVIVTGITHPPLWLLPKLWKNETCEVTVPYFDEMEVTEMVRAHGLSDSKRMSAWVQIISLTTSGHPQLVHARVRNLSAKGWPSIEFSDLTKPEDVARVRSDARNRLVQEFPSENTRVLAYRLSLINGVFSRETAIAVAEIPPPTKLPGEAFDALVGPWIEREGENRYRVSPLLTGAADNVLSKADIESVHGAIALTIISRGEINQLEVGTAFFHAFMAKHTIALSQLASGVLDTDSKNLPLLHDAMRWFPLACLDAGQKILPDNPKVELKLRLAQYKLIASSSETDKALAVIERIEETLSEPESLECAQLSEVLAYCMVLNGFNVQIPSSTVIRMLSRIIDCAEENVDVMALFDSLGKKQTGLPLLGENKPAQILFSYQGARLSGLDDLSDLVTSLDALPLSKREHLLRAFNSDIDFAVTLVNRAWWKDTKGETLDVNKALKVIEFTLLKAQEWGIPELTKACAVAISVIHDEYGHSTERALEVLDDADKEFPNEASLVNQRAKVLFNANLHREALPLAVRALELPGLSAVSFVFCCRNGGMAAAEFGDWKEAERLFLLGVEKAKGSSVQEDMGIGLTADAAFALWRQKKYEDSLLLFADVLDSLRTIPLSDDIRKRHLHATIRHSIGWIHFDARGECHSSFVEPTPGMCSNQEPDERIKDHQIVDINAAWELLALTERILELDIGIGVRAQAATGGKKTQLLAGYAYGLAFDRIFKNKEFDNLIPTLVEMARVIDHSITLKEGRRDERSILDIPKLSDEHWQNPRNRIWIYQNILIASVIHSVFFHPTTLPIERWRSDLGIARALSDHVNQFLDVLNGTPPDTSLYQQSAASLFLLRRGNLSPVQLWRGSFRLLNAFVHEKRVEVESALERLLIPQWLFAISNQKFAFSTPSLACPEIERHCLDQSLNGLSKIATVLDSSAPFLNMRVSSDARQMIKGMLTKDS